MYNLPPIYVLYTLLILILIIHIAVLGWHLFYFLWPSGFYTEDTVCVKWLSFSIWYWKEHSVITQRLNCLAVLVYPAEVYSLPCYLALAKLPWATKLKSIKYPLTLHHLCCTHNLAATTTDPKCAQNSGQGCSTEENYRMMM